MDESLIALKDCKRVVELRYKNVLIEKTELDQKIECLTQQNELLQVKNQSLEERLATLENEKSEQTEILAEIQQNLIQKTSEYESQIRCMQVELDNRLDEVNVNKKEDVDKVKEHYIELFEEKAAEVMSLRNDLDASNTLIEEYKLKCTDLEYREEELNDLVNKMRTDNMKAEESDINNKLEASYSKTVLLQEKLDIIKIGFEEMKIREKERITKFESTIENLHLIISEKNDEILKLSNPQENFKENTLPVVNVNESHSSHNVSKNSDDQIHNNCLPNYEEITKPVLDIKNKNKKKKKKNRN